MGGTAEHACAAGAETHVVVSDAMRALFRRHLGIEDPADPAAGHDRGDAPAAKPEAEAPATPPDTTPVARPSENSGPVHRLPRDGLRPLAFHGHTILRRDAPAELGPGPHGEAPARHVFALHLASDGSIIAELRLAVAHGAPLRPVNTAADLAEAGGLDAVLASHDPARGLVAPLEGPDGAAIDAARVAAGLRAGLRRLVAEALAPSAAPAAVIRDTALGDPG